MRSTSIVTACGLVAVLFVMYLPVTAFLPFAPPIAFAGGERIPASTITGYLNAGVTYFPFPEFVRTRVINITYVANGTAGSSGVFWTELYYRIPGGDWKLYSPPWNREGRWFGQLGFEGGLIRGMIPFDTFYTGDEATYEFYTVGVDRGYWREGMPRDHAKAKTTLDTRPPNVFVGKPSPNAWTKDGMLTWTSTDAVSGLASVRAVLDAGAAMAFAVDAGAKEASGVEDLHLSVEGDHDVLVRAADRAGNTAEIFVPFHFDPNAPALSITAPEAGRYLASVDVQVAWTAGDSASGIASQSLRLDSQAAIPLTGDVTSYLASGLGERIHTVTIVVFDEAGNYASDSVSFGVDVTAPSLDLLAPRDESFSTEHDLQVLWLGSDAVSGIERFEVRFRTLESPPIPSGAMHTFSNVAEGDGTVRVVAIDHAGNRAEVTADVTVDYTAPVLTITKPGASAEVTGDLTIGWTATDPVSGIDRYELVYDGVKTPVEHETSYHVAEPRVGAHVAVVRAWDQAGNRAEKLVSFTYGVSGPIQPSNFPSLEFWLLILLIGAIAVGSAYYAVRRRNRSKA